LVTRPVAPILIREAPLGGPNYGHHVKRYDYPGKAHITKDDSLHDPVGNLEAVALRIG